jgi:glycosyltransferase involved in cell wall biosynthesis
MESNTPASTARSTPLLVIVVPCFNEEEVLPETASRLEALIDRLRSDNQIASGSGVLLVDDGSSDRTWNLIEDLARRSGTFRGLKLARNFGHQSAILAGILSAESDITITIDADLQDPPEAIADMIAAHRSGADIVYGVREDRSSDSAFKRTTAQAFYKLMKFMGVELISNHADFRLLNKEAINALKQFGEINLFLRGLIPLLGFNQQIIHYKREPRFAGKSKYSFAKMLMLSIDGITSFSVYPLRLITILGLLVSLLAFAAALWALGAWIFNAGRVPGWTSIVLPMYFLGGVQLLSIGILGEYLGKSYFETKRRPRFIVEKAISQFSPADRRPMPPASTP